MRDFSSEAVPEIRVNQVNFRLGPGKPIVSSGFRNSDSYNSDF